MELIIISAVCGLLVFFGWALVRVSEAGDKAEAEAVRAHVAALQAQWKRLLKHDDKA